MEDLLIHRVRIRARNRCEYCRIPQDLYPVPFQVDHIIARQHGGSSMLNNLALSCLHCNGHKGPNIAGLDPRTRRLTAIFDPRRHRWDRHFRWKGAIIVGRTQIGRTTVAVLNMNGMYLLRLRQDLIAEGHSPWSGGVE